MHLRVAVIGLLFWCFSGCSNPFATTSNTVTITAVPEDQYCPGIVAISGASITITSNAIYYYRPTNVSLGLYGNPVSDKISFAEVIVKSSAGAIVQCGNTDADGNISIAIPKAAGTYSLIVNSRANNAKLHISVLNDINANIYYSLMQVFSISATDTSPKSVTGLVAKARASEDPEIKGAAFNIMKDIYRANEYIRSSLGDTTWAAPKVSVYWKAGFNPNSYRDAAYADQGLSYYSTGNRKLYILGGINGQVKGVDTDHFDDSVVIHEYGHFLEDVYAKQDSPGGSHSGNSIIDPRLAWSEGWANFLQSAVQTNWNNTLNTVVTDANVSRGKRYIDTIGFSGDSVETGGSGSIAISFDLTLAGGSASGQDAVGSAGEGTFREMSVARTLYKTIATATTNASLHADVPFSAIWSSFSSSSSGLASAASVFRNIGLFNHYLDLLITGSFPSSAANWTNVLSDEKQNKTSIDYANPLVDPGTTSANCAAKTISPVIDAGPTCDTSTGLYSVSNKLKSNDFYVYYHDGSNTTLDINYSASAASAADLDLNVYSYSHSSYEDCYGMYGYQFSDFGGAVRSARRYGSTESGSETVNLGGLPVGYYMINVKAYTLNKSSGTLSTQGSQYTFAITKNGVAGNICPKY